MTTMTLTKPTSKPKTRRAAPKTPKPKAKAKAKAKTPAKTKTTKATKATKTTKAIVQVLPKPKAKAPAKPKAKAPAKAKAKAKAPAKATTMRLNTATGKAAKAAKAKAEKWTGLLIDGDASKDDQIRTCPKCGCGSQGEDAIDERFGFRNMKRKDKDGKVVSITRRPQSQCKKCRSIRPPKTMHLNTKTPGKAKA